MTIIDRIKSIDSSDTKELYSIFNSIKGNFAIIPFDLKAGEKIIMKAGAHIITRDHRGAIVLALHAYSVDRSALERP